MPAGSVTHATCVPLDKLLHYEELPRIVYLFIWKHLCGLLYLLRAVCLLSPAIISYSCMMSISTAYLLKVRKKVCALQGTNHNLLRYQ